MHMNYADYVSYKHGSDGEAVRKETLQRTLFQQADKHFAVGPLLSNAMRDIVDGEVAMLIPGFAQVQVRPATHSLTLITFGRMDRESDRIKQGALAVAGFASAVRSAEQPGMPGLLRDNPQMRVVGISEEKGAEEESLRKLATAKSGREINLIAQPFDEERAALFDQLGRSNIALMLSWHEGFGLTGWEAIAAEVPLIVSKQSGLYRLVHDVLGDPGTACLQVIDVRGQEGDDDISNFTQADEDDTRDAILKIASDLPKARENARLLKELLQQRQVCTWDHAAQQFCEALGVAVEQVRGGDAVDAPVGRGEATKESKEPDAAGQQGGEAAASIEESAPPLIGMPEHPWPDSLAIEMPDSIMLLPQSEVVPFHSNRRYLLDEVLGWALADDQPIKLRLQAGEGGTGKTRLALAVCRELEDQHGWRVGFLRSPDRIENEFPKLLREGRDCLVVIDYAETRTNHVVALVQGALKASGVCKVRLLLLARDGGDWWDRLAEGAKDTALAAILRSPSTKTGPFRMSEERIEPEARAAVFDEALAAFATAKQTPAEAVERPDLGADHFGQILFIHLAALAALRGSEATGDRELLAMALGHERAYWRHLLEGAGLDEACFDGLQQAIALLTLVGGADSARDAKVLLARTPRLRGRPYELKTKLFDLLRRLYRRSGGLAGLQPDVLGECLVADALARDDELIDVAFEQASTEEQARSAFTVLTRLAKRDPTERRWLVRALERHIVDRGQEALEVALETGSPMPEAMVAVLQAAERRVQRRVVKDLRPRLPDETVNLKGLAIDIADHHVVFVRAEKGGRKGWKAAKQLKEAYEDLARRHQAKGDPKEVAEARERALHFTVELGRSGKGADAVPVAGARLNLAAALSEIGSFEEALDQAEAAEAAFREAADRHPDAYRSGWARSLASLGNRLGDLGRYEEALAKTERAEAIYRDLADRQPDTYRVLWASDLGTLGGRLGALGRYGEALAKSEQAEAISRDLAEREPDAYRADWAAELDNLASVLSDFGRYEEALAKSGEAEAIYRDMAKRQPDAYRAVWAAKLGNLANHLRDLERYEEALARSEQSEAIYRDLAEQQPDAYRARWAVALGNLAEISTRCDRAGEAVSVASQAVDVLVPLAIYPNVRRDWLGWCTRVLAEALLHTGDATLALKRAREADRIWATIFAERPAYASEQYGKTLPVLARAEFAAEGASAAIRTLDEGIKRIEPYFEQRPRALQQIMEGLIATFREIDPAAATERIPARVVETLSQLPRSA